MPASGSLFDIEPDESQPAVEAGEDPAGDSTTDGDTDRAVDDADTDVEPEPVQQPSPSGSGPTPASSIPEGSLFDIEETDEPEPALEAGEDPAGDATTDGDTDRAADDADTDVEPEQPKAEEEQPPIRSIKEIKAEFADEGDAAEKTPATTETGQPDATDAAADSDADAAEDTRDADDDAEDEPARPSGSGEKHTPKTDAKIDDSSSLFDL